MCGLMGSPGAILATAMAVSGTVVLLVFCRQRPVPSPAISAARLADADGAGASPAGSLPPSASDPREGESKGEKESQRRRKKKRVQFAEQVVVLHAGACGAEEEEDGGPVQEEPPPEVPRVRRGLSECGRRARGGMPANRVALYSGMLRDRHHRMGCSY